MELEESRELLQSVGSTQGDAAGDRKLLLVVSTMAALTVGSSTLAEELSRQVLPVLSIGREVLMMFMEGQPAVVPTHSASPVSTVVLAPLCGVCGCSSGLVAEEVGLVKMPNLDPAERGSRW